MKIIVNIDQIYNTQYSGPVFLFAFFFCGSLRLVQKMLIASLQPQIKCIHHIPVSFLGLAEVGRGEFRGEETTSLERLVAREQVGLIGLNPLTMDHAFN